MTENEEQNRIGTTAAASVSSSSMETLSTCNNHANAKKKKRNDTNSDYQLDPYFHTIIAPPRRSTRRRRQSLHPSAMPPTTQITHPHSNQDEMDSETTIHHLPFKVIINLHSSKDPSKESTTKSSSTRPGPVTKKNRTCCTKSNTDPTKMKSPTETENTITGSSNNNKNDNGTLPIMLPCTKKPRRNMTYQNSVAITSDTMASCQIKTGTSTNSSNTTTNIDQIMVHRINDKVQELFDTNGRMELLQRVCICYVLLLQLYFSCRLLLFFTHREFHLLLPPHPPSLTAVRIGSTFCCICHHE